MGGAQGRFPTTCWSAILSARTTDDDRRRLIIDELARAYWKPICCYFLRQGYGNEDAKDLTQDFFCKFFLEGTLLQTADREVGRFRQLLMTALKRFVRNVRRDGRRRKRTPKGAIFSLDGPDLANIEVPAAAATPEKAFYYAWVTNLLDQVLAEIRVQYCSSDMATHWEVFHLKVLAPIFEDAEEASLAEICRQCGVKDESTASNMIITVKRRFRKVLRRRLRDLTGSDTEAEAEFDDLFRFLDENGAG